MRLLKILWIEIELVLDSLYWLWLAYFPMYIWVGLTLLSISVGLAIINHPAAMYTYYALFWMIGLTEIIISKKKHKKWCLKNVVHWVCVGVIILYCLLFFTMRDQLGLPFNMAIIGILLIPRDEDDDDHRGRRWRKRKEQELESLKQRLQRVYSPA